MSWHRETLYPYIHQSIRIDEDLYHGRTAFQSVRIFRNEAVGRVLILDDVVQTTEADEFVYHEMLAHLPILAHGAVRRVLIVGGGDGGCLEEVLKHAVEQVVMVELDEEVVQLAREFLPAISNGAFDDPRLELTIGDGSKYVNETAARFDLIIVDSTDPIGPGEVLFQAPFYAGCHRCLNPDGILITQNGVPFFQRAEYLDTGAARARLFAHSGFYFAAVPTYFGGDLAFGWASDETDLAKPDVTLIRERYQAADLDTRFYNPEIHQAALALPNYLSRLQN